MPDFLLAFAGAAASLRRQPEALMASFRAGPNPPGVTLLKWLPWKACSQAKAPCLTNILCLCCADLLEKMTSRKWLSQVTTGKDEPYQHHPSEERLRMLSKSLPITLPSAFSVAMSRKQEEHGAVHTFSLKRRNAVNSVALLCSSMCAPSSAAQALTLSRNFRNA